MNIRQEMGFYFPEQSWQRFLPEELEFLRCQGLVDFDPCICISQYNLDKIDMRNCISILCDEGIFGDGAGCEIMEGKKWNINRY